MPSSADALRATCTARREALDQHAAAVVADPGKGVGAMLHNTILRGAQIADTLMHKCSMLKTDLTGATLERVRAVQGRIRESRVPIGGVEGADEMIPERAVTRQRVAKYKDPRIVAQSRGEVFEL